MMWIIAILIIILTLSILKDTHVEVYSRYGSLCGTKLQREYDLVVPVWVALIVVVLGLLPLGNIALFVAFATYYMVHAWWDPKGNDGETHVFSLRGCNIITRGLLKAKNLLCKEV